MATTTAATTTATKWTAALKDFAETVRTSEAKALAALEAMCREVAPAYRLATLDHIGRARRISCASIVTKIRALAGLAEDFAKLANLIESTPHLYVATKPGLGRLTAKIAAEPGWNINPPATEDAVLNAMTNDETARLRILIELARSRHNAFSALAVAFADAGRHRPELFGATDARAEGDEITAALAQVAEVRSALAAQPSLLAALAAKYGVASAPDAVLAAVAASTA